jgi:hypothetical protein
MGVSVPKKVDSLGLSNAIGGGHTARSMMYQEMRTLAGTLPADAKKGDFSKAILDENILEKPTQSSREKSLQHLVQLYGLDPSRALFRVLWQLGHSDLDSLPQLCLVCAYTRDPQLRHSFELIRSLRLGEAVERTSMELHLERGFPGRFSPATKKSMAQNVNTTWTFGGLLAGRTRKTRQAPQPRPASAAYAMLAGYLKGLRGEQLLESPFASLVASNRAELLTALSLASARGLLSLKIAAGIVEFDFTSLLTPAELELLHESH